MIETPKVERGPDKIETEILEPYKNVSLLKARSIAHSQHYIVSLKQIEIVIEQRSYADVKCKESKQSVWW